MMNSLKLFLAQKVLCNKMARYADIKSLGEVLKEYVDGLQKKTKYDETRITANWAKIVGPIIAKRTANVYVKADKLFLTIDSAPLKQEMQAMESNILESVNTFAGRELVTKIIFK